MGLSGSWKQLLNKHKLKFKKKKKSCSVTYKAVFLTLFHVKDP